MCSCPVPQVSRVLSVVLPPCAPGVEAGDAGGPRGSRPADSKSGGGGMFGKLMSGVNKWADKANDKLDKAMAKTVEKLGITD